MKGRKARKPYVRTAPSDAPQQVARLPRFQGRQVRPGCRVRLKARLPSCQGAEGLRHHPDCQCGKIKRVQSISGSILEHRPRMRWYLNFTDGRGIAWEWVEGFAEDAP